MAELIPLRTALQSGLIAPGVRLTFWYHGMPIYSGTVSDKGVYTYSNTDYCDIIRDDGTPGGAVGGGWVIDIDHSDKLVEILSSVGISKCSRCKTNASAAMVEGGHVCGLCAFDVDACELCGKITLVGAKLHGGGVVCIKCRNGMRKCEACHEFFTEDDDPFFDVHGEICDKCSDTHFRCSCGQITTISDSRTPPDGYDMCCDSCFDDKYASCQSCGTIVVVDDIRTIGDDSLCDRCFDDQGYICDSCGRAGWVDDANSHYNEEYEEYEDELYCDRCFRERNRSSIESRQATEDDVASILEMLTGATPAIRRRMLTFNKKDIGLASIVADIGPVERPIHLFGVANKRDYAICCTPDILAALQASGIASNGTVTTPIGGSTVEVVERDAPSLGFHRKLRENHRDWCCGVVRNITSRDVVAT